MKSLSPFKRGNTFGATCIYKEDGIPQDITDLTITCQLRDPETKELVSAMVVTKADQTEELGKFFIAPANGSTADWPIKVIVADILVFQGGVKRSTQTFRIPVIEAVTETATE